ncbi:MAG: helix-turn-helix transcriptional regulator [Ruminococcaceae bacterium]|nr:helix-turn-helix transcriptional regulator [Oscillospiraceae bacterium]
MNIGEIIYTQRKKLNLTLEDIGKVVGVSKSTVKKWESGYIANIKRDKIAALAKILNLNPVIFIDDSLISETLLI